MLIFQWELPTILLSVCGYSVDASTPTLAGAPVSTPVKFLWILLWVLLRKLLSVSTHVIWCVNSPGSMTVNVPLGTPVHILRSTPVSIAVSFVWVPPCSLDHSCKDPNELSCGLWTLMGLLWSELLCAAWWIPLWILLCATNLANTVLNTPVSAPARSSASNLLSTPLRTPVCSCGPLLSPKSRHHSQNGLIGMLHKMREYYTIWLTIKYAAQDVWIFHNMTHY